MKEIMKLLSQLSEHREAYNKRLAETAGEDAAKREAELTPLRDRIAAKEVEFREAVARHEEREATPVPELPDRVELRNYLSAALTGKQVTGAEKELNEERGLDTLNMVPWDAFLPLSVEERTDDATVVPAAVLGHPQEAVLARIFKRSQLTFLGARMPSVASGEPIYPVMTGGTSGGAFSAGTAVQADTATFVGETVGPTRLSARYKWRMEDSVRFPVEAALREDLRMVMSDLIDTQVFTGSGTAPNMNGLFRNHASGPLGVNATESRVTDYNQVLTKLYSYVDGAAAANVSEVRTLIGVATNAKLGIVREDNGKTIYETVGSLGAAFATSAHVPAAVSNVQQAIQTRRGTDLIVPVWQGVTMIRDMYTGAASAEVSLTAHFLANLKLLRSDNWRKIAYKIA